MQPIEYIHGAYCPISHHIAFVYDGSDYKDGKQKLDKLFQNKDLSPEYLVYHETELTMPNNQPGQKIFDWFQNLPLTFDEKLKIQLYSIKLIASCSINPTNYILNINDIEDFNIDKIINTYVLNKLY